jgi:hypothetical protein
LNYTPTTLGVQSWTGNFIWGYANKNGWIPLAQTIPPCDFMTLLDSVEWDSNARVHGEWDRISCGVIWHLFCTPSLREHLRHRKQLFMRNVTVSVRIQCMQSVNVQCWIYNCEILERITESLSGLHNDTAHIAEILPYISAFVWKGYRKTTKKKTKSKI